MSSLIRVNCQNGPPTRHQTGSDRSGVDKYALSGFQIGFLESNQVQKILENPIELGVIHTGSGGLNIQVGFGLKNNVKT